MKMIFKGLYNKEESNRVILWNLIIEGADNQSFFSDCLLPHKQQWRYEASTKKLHLQKVRHLFLMSIS
jgi:hypothetical protein